MKRLVIALLSLVMLLPVSEVNAQNFAAQFAIISVKDSLYNATGDGVADDTSKIQATIDAVESRGGGIVFIPEGTFLVSSTLTVNTDFVVIRGAGTATIIKNTNTGGAAAITFDNVTNCAIQSLRILGNASSGDTIAFLNSAAISVWEVQLDETGGGTYVDVAVVGGQITTLPNDVFVVGDDLFGVTTDGTVTAQNKTDGASVQQGIFKGGNRATPGDGDESYWSFYLDDSTGAQVEFGRLTWEANDVTNTTKDGEFRLGVIVNNVLTDQIFIDETGVGIGTSPTDKLTVQGNLFVRGGNKIGTLNSGNTNSLELDYFSDTEARLRNSKFPTGKIHIQIGATDIATFTVTGMGVNDPTPDAMLDIVGTTSSVGLIIENAATTPSDLMQLNSSGGASGDRMRVASNGDTTLTKAAIGATADEDTFAVVNTTAAAAGAQQYSPVVRWEGQGWRTNATAETQKVEFRSYVIPVEGTANPTGDWVLESSVNDAAYVQQMRVTSGGVVSVVGNVVLDTTSTVSALTTVGTLDTGDATAIVDAAGFGTPGKVALATISETNTGTDVTIAVTPDGLDGWTGSAQVVTVGTITTGTWAAGNVAPGSGSTVALDTTAGITASTTQSQGNGVLTAQVNQISTVANPDDTVTLLSAFAGVTIEIINDGAFTLLIFPASGDNLGTGVDQPEQLEANETVQYVAYDATNWSKAATTEIIHAEMHDEDNTDVFVVNDAGADFHSYHTNALAAGDLADWTFDAGGAGTSFPIASIADGAASGVDIAVTTTGTHGLAVGDIISQTNLANAAYVGIFNTKAIISTTVYEVAAVFTATGTGTMDQASTLTASVGSAGVYQINYWMSATSATNNETFDFEIYKQDTRVVGTKVRRKFGTAADFGSMSGGGIVSVADGDRISLALSNEDSAGNLTVRNLTMTLLRL